MLAFVQESIDSGDDIGDDGVLGYGFIRAGLSKFRGAVNNLEARITLEKAKSSSRQTPRTTARDVRRTFLLLGMVRRNGTAWMLTDRGKRILAAHRGELSQDAATTEWITALLNLKFRAATDKVGLHTTERVRPLRVMLEMLDTTTLPKSHLALAFSASDETDASLAHVNGLVNSLATGVLTWTGALATVGASKSLAANNVKIIPSIAVQLGLIATQPTTSMTELGKSALRRMRASRPIWLTDLNSRVAPSALLVVLQVEEISESDATALLAPTAQTLDEALAVIAGAGVSVERVDGRLRLQTEVSFDPYQDVPDAVYADAVYQAALARIASYVSLTLTETPPTILAVTTKLRRVTHTRRFVSAAVEEEEAIQTEQTPAFSYEELLAKRQAGIIARERRTKQHTRLQELVADHYRAKYGVEPRVSDLYDLYLLPTKLFIAHEMKTVTPQDERERIREAVGQLLYYEFFELPGIAGDDCEVINIVAVDHPLTDGRHKDFLAKLGIGLVWADGNTLHFDGIAQAMLGKLPPV